MVSKVTGVDDEGSANRGETFSLFRDTICANIDAFYAEYDKKKDARNPIFAPVDDDFFDAFLESRDKELSESTWNALGKNAQQDFDAKIIADEELKAWCEKNGGIK